MQKSGRPSIWILLSVLTILVGVSVRLAQASEPVEVVAGALIATPTGSYSDITPQALNSTLNEQPEFFALVNVHIPYEGEIVNTDALIPFDVIASRLDKLPADKNAPIVLYCMSGRMSKIAATTLVKLGYTNVKDLRGGMIAWQHAGLPVTTR